jgi:hypothetical protein
LAVNARTGRLAPKVRRVRRFNVMGRLLSRPVEKNIGDRKYPR